MRFLSIAIVALLIQLSAHAQNNTFPTPSGSVGIGTTAPDAKLHVLDNGRNYFVNKTIAGATEDSQGINYLLLHEAYSGTASIDRHLFGKITGIRGSTIVWNRKITVEVNTATAYTGTEGTIISYSEPTRLVTLTFNGKLYLALEIANTSSIAQFSFTGYANNADLVLVTDNVVTNVQAFNGFYSVAIPGNLSLGSQSSTARLTLYGGANWTTNNWAKSVKMYNGHAIEFTANTRSFGMGASGNNFYLFHANTDGSGAANYSMIVDGSTGNVGIGTGQPPAMYKLAVEGAIGARRVKVMQGTWADFVFHDDYKLPSLFEVESFVKQNKHLPGIPTEAEVKKDGVDIGEMNKLLLQKVEELTLYIIDLKKESLKQQEKIGQLEKKLK